MGWSNQDHPIPFRVVLGFYRSSIDCIVSSSSKSVPGWLQRLSISPLAIGPRFTPPQAENTHG